MTADSQAFEAASATFEVAIVALKVASDTWCSLQRIKAFGTASDAYKAGSEAFEAALEAFEEASDTFEEWFLLWWITATNLLHYLQCILHHFLELYARLTWTVLQSNFNLNQIDHYVACFSW